MVEPALRGGLEAMEALASSAHEASNASYDFPLPRSGPSLKRWPATLYDYASQRVADARLTSVDVEHGKWVHCKVCNCQLRCDTRNLFSNERWNRHLRRSKKHKEAVARGELQTSSATSVHIGDNIIPSSPQRERNKTKRRKLTQHDVDAEFQSQLDQNPTNGIHDHSACPGALPPDSFDMLQIFARFGQIPHGAQVVRGADAPGFQLFSTRCTKRMESRRKNQPDCCTECFVLFVDANLKKRIFQNMKTYARVLAVLESPALPDGGLVDLQNFLKIPVRNMNHAGKKLRLLVEGFVEFHKAKKDNERHKTSVVDTKDRIAQIERQKAELDLKVARARAEHELVKLGMSLGDSQNLLVL
ncbi:Aste57867_13180 [Aphanomyces stellatus]|uniref:Aste57867_13180 protein n=1 Tax=Aphanomyces stellatus TaxID=120398 RepID=A0A485KYC1_9STRA|nr:hypothetical protein As57867_013131 [Aphanomyces stellatus]VFT90021.1 Aste57867_13180 [Aphanomyces stellatus]